ncbi:Tetratricopeptide repeat-containing protein (Fragment) OS=Streptomyces microflavus OX=1919 GN=G3I39_16005 PE=4 SV=1 [Streptomyces microflavus]
MRPTTSGGAAALLGAVLDELRPPGWEPAEAGAGSWVDEADQLEIEARVRLVTLLQASDDPADAEQAERHLELLAATVPDGHATQDLRLRAHLVDVYREREGGVRPEERPAYLARLRELYRQLARRREPAPCPGWRRCWARRWRSGSGSRGARYMPTAENEEARTVLREALAGLAEDDELRLPGHAVLGCLLNRCHDFDPTAYDNEEALLHERAVDLCPPDDPMRGDLLDQSCAHATIVRDDRCPTDLEGVDRTIALLNEMMKVPSDTPGFGSQAHGAYAAALSQATRSPTPRTISTRRSATSPRRFRQTRSTT